MDQWAKASTQGTGPKRTRQNNGSGKSAPDAELDHKLLVAASKLASHLATKSRLHDAHLMQTATLDTQSQLVTISQETGKEWAAAKKAGTAEGVPYHKLYAKLVLAMLQEKEVIEDVECGPILKDHSVSIKNITDLEGKICLCKISKAWQRGTHKLQISFGSQMQEVKGAFLRALRVHYGASIKEGMAPRSAHEREVHTILQEMGEYEEAQ